MQHSHSHLLVSLSLLCTAGCSHTQLPEQTRARLNAKLSYQTVELKHSSYFGDLYDDNAHYLLSPYAFDETSHIVDLAEKPIHPSGQRGIVPAGTRFRVEKVEFPDGGAMAKRMLTTPRFNPWVYLRLDDPDTHLPTDRPYILLLPVDLENSKQVTRAFKRRLGAEGEVQAWLGERKPSIAAAIRHKDVIPGMTIHEMVASLGLPKRWFQDQLLHNDADVAWYESREVWLVDDFVARSKPGRTVAAAP